MDEKNRRKIDIELDEEVAQGIYSNLVAISHSHSEFVVDFIRMLPNVPKAKVKSRIILTPEHAKGLLVALKDNIAKYEASHGQIKNPGGQGPMIPMNFGGPKPEA